MMAVLCLLAAPCAAAEYSDALGTDELEQALPEAAEQALGEMTVEDAALDSGLEKILAFLQGQFHAVLAEVLRPLTAVTAITLLYAIVRPLQTAHGALDPVGFGACAAVSAAALGDVSSVFSLGQRTLLEMADFSHALLPTLTAAACAAGAPTSAGVKYAAGALFSDLLLTAANDLILPLLCAYTAAACANAALNGVLAGPVRLAAWSARMLMKALVLCFTGYLSLSGVIASGADAAAVKAAKAAIGTMLPVVGKTVADASEALVAGAGLIRNSVGVFGLLAALGVLALPLLRLGLRYLLFKAAAALLSAAAGDRVAKLIDAVASAYGMVLGLVGSGAAILFLSVFSLIRTVSG